MTTDTDTTTNHEDTEMTTDTITSPAISLVVGDCYVLAGTNPGAVWALDGDNGRGWLLFSLVDGEDPKATRRVRASAVLAPLSCSGPVSEPTRAPGMAIRGSGPTLVAGPSSEAEESQGEAPDRPLPLDSLGAAPTRRQTAKAQAQAERAARLALAREERALARIVAADLKAATKAKAAEAKAQAKAQAVEAKVQRGEYGEFVGSTMSRTLRHYSVRYLPAKNASGCSTKINGDPLAIAWLALDVDAFCIYAAALLGMSPRAYAHLNPGQQRMNYGNRLRAQIRKGNITEDQALAGLPTLAIADADD